MSIFSVKIPNFGKVKKILDFRNRSYSDVSGKYQNIEKPLKHQRRLGLRNPGE